MSKGKIDFLFVEAAVNDYTNESALWEQVCGMEGKVRHTLLSNSEMEIVMLHFIHVLFTSMLVKGQQADMVLNHERMQASSTWEQFSGPHPSPFDCRYYAATINHLSDKMWQSITSYMVVASLV